jgi:ABC-type multidrug transport system ATPase subunit
MQVEASEISKIFGKQLVLDKVSLKVPEGGSLAILGRNGSGKTTLLRCISGLIRPNSGSIKWSRDDTSVDYSEWPQRLTYAAPYMELIEELTLSELLNLQGSLRQFQSGLTSSDVLNISGLEKAKNKEIRFFSSGMKQRLKLTLAYCTSSDIVFLDEPTSNLDEQAIRWFQELSKEWLKARTLIIGSNHIDSEMSLCKDSLDLSKR